jgi:phosphotransferase system HPr (HPr) family protein
VADQTDELKLVTLLDRQTVEAKASVRDWEEAADRVGGLLVNAGRVEPTYIDAMKRVLREMGPYAVIAPGIVLLHARPAAVFVKQASQYNAEINLRNVTTDSEWANAKSILSVLTLGVEKNHRIELEIDGADEDQAVAGLSSLVQANFGETQPES